MTSPTSIEVRGNAGSAALAAACLIFFGYFSTLTKPSGDSWFAFGNLIFFYVLRVGGVAMAIIAVWSWAGHCAALLADAIVSVAIGALFWASSAMMILDDGPSFNRLLFLVFGAVFIAAGIRNGRAYFVIIAERRTMSPLDEDRYIRDRDFSQPSSDRSLAGELLGRRHDDEVPENGPPPRDAGDSDDEFLASFAPDDDSDKS